MVKTIAQIISILGMCVSVISFQQKKQATLLTFQVFSCLLFMTSFFLLNAYVGAILNVIALIRAVLFLYKDKFKSDHIAWLIGFLILFIAIYVLTFTVFGTKPSPLNFVIEILPIVGMTASHIGFMKNNTKSARRYGLISSPSWLIYNVYYTSIGAIMGEVCNLISIVLGIFRHDIKRKNTTKE